MYLLDRGIRVTGTDAWSWDAPFSYTAKKVEETGDTSLIREGHKAGRDIGYCHLEKLHNLEVLPASGFMVSCFPHKIKGASASEVNWLSPLPRAWQWLDGSAFDSHGTLMQKAFGLDPIVTDKPLMYQGMSHVFFGPDEGVPFVSESDGIDFEGEFGVIDQEVVKA